MRYNKIALLNSERAVVVIASLADYYWQNGLTVMVSLGGLSISTHMAPDSWSAQPKTKG